MSSSTDETAPFIEAFRRGLRELGYIEGKNILLEIRGGEARRDRLSDLAAELAGLKIVTGAISAVHAVKEATSTIPIVMRYDSDPVRTGVVASLARPGGNITGLNSITRELLGKRLELLLAAVPEAQRIAVLTAISDRARFMATDEYKEVDAAARALGVKLQVLQARDPATIDKAFLAMQAEHAQAFMVIPSARYFQHRERIIKHR